MRQHLGPENEAVPGTLHGPSMGPPWAQAWALHGAQSGSFMGQAWAQAQAGWGSLVQGHLNLYEKKKIPGNCFWGRVKARIPGPGASRRPDFWFSPVPIGEFPGNVPSRTGSTRPVPVTKIPGFFFLGPGPGLAC